MSPKLQPAGEQTAREYFTLQEAYDAYVEALADPKYDAVRDTQASAP